MKCLKNIVMAIALMALSVSQAFSAVDMRAQAVKAAGGLMIKTVAEMLSSSDAKKMDINDLSQNSYIKAASLVTGILGRIGVNEVESVDALKIVQMIKVHGQNIEASHLAWVGVASVKDSDLTQLKQHILVRGGDITARAGSKIAAAVVKDVESSKKITQKIVLDVVGKIDAGWKSEIGVNRVSH